MTLVIHPFTLESSLITVLGEGDELARVARAGEVYPGWHQSTRPCINQSGHASVNRAPRQSIELRVS